MQESATVVITTRNRKDELKVALESVLHQKVDLEVLVFDDASTDGTVEMVMECFPSVRCVRVEERLGIVNARNRAIPLALGSIAVVMDDDCVLVSDQTIAQTLKDFDDPRIGAVAVPHIYVRSDGKVRSKAPSETGTFLCAAFAGGAVALRRDLFLALGGYNSSLWMGFEELDYCIRTLDVGYVTRCGNADPLHHVESMHRDGAAILRNQIRSGMLYVWSNVPWPWLPAYLCGSVVQKLVAGIRQGLVAASLAGLIAGFRAIIGNLARRAPVRRRTYRLFQELRSAGALPIERIERKLIPPNPTRELQWPPQES